MLQASCGCCIFTQDSLMIWRNTAAGCVLILAGMMMLFGMPLLNTAGLLHNKQPSLC